LNDLTERFPNLSPPELKKDAKLNLSTLGVLPISRIYSEQARSSGDPLTEWGFPGQAQHHSRTFSSSRSRKRWML